jgi:hypothetical protein
MALLKIVADLFYFLLRGWGNEGQDYAITFCLCVGLVGLLLMPESRRWLLHPSIKCS